MASITISIPDAQVPRALAAFAKRLDKDVADVTAADIKAELLDLVKIIVRQHEKEEAERAISVTDLDVS